jgi:CheY-like chemotaxis protein
MHVLAVRAAEKGLELACRVSPDVPDALRGDPGRLRQIVINLVGNAIKFTEKGEVALAVLVEEQAPEEVRLHFQVSDTGIGIPADKLQRIFDPFSQADSSTTRRYGGTGLGLSISQQLVAMMGGRMWVQSEVDKGSTFHFLLRFAHCLTRPTKKGDLPTPIECPSAQDSKTTSPSAPAARARRIVRPRRVLVAEDSAINQEVVVGLLRLRGHQVVVTNNGDEALAALEREAFDVVLMDVQMPDMDGFEATARIRHREQAGGGHVPIIAMTAHAMAGDCERCLAAGMDGYLPKPVVPDQLYEAVEGTCDGGHRAPCEKESLPPPAAVIDWEKALHCVGGQAQLLRQMANVFLKECAGRMAAIHQAVTARDATGLKKSAHTLKGAADCFAARPAVAAASRLEMMGSEGTLTGVEEAWTALKKEIDQLLAALQPLTTADRSPTTRP